MLIDFRDKQDFEGQQNLQFSLKRIDALEVCSSIRLFNPLVLGSCIYYSN